MSCQEYHNLIWERIKTGDALVHWLYAFECHLLALADVQDMAGAIPLPMKNGHG